MACTKNEKYKYYCTSCGLCKALGKSDLVSDNRGFSHPANYDQDFLAHICPVAGLQSERLSSQSIWGKNEGVYLGWSSDELIRKQASSGGILTSLAIFLLTENIVDGVIHIHSDISQAYGNNTVISTSVDEIKSGSGSRYSISHPLDVIRKLDETKRYCLIAKPCDISVFRNYSILNPEIKNRIIFTMSFFCMGLPSNDAQKRLLEKLECSADCVSLSYRGNGWPGYATAIDSKGTSHKVTYNESWGKILGRDLMDYCRYCIDGIGEEADISCGDAWYIKNGQPDFNEHEGRNVIFARTTLGDEILKKAYSLGRIVLNDFNDYENYLPVIQNSQYMRRATLISRIMGLKVMRKAYPKYNMSLMKFYGSHIPVRKNIRGFFGMMRRINNGRA